MPAVAREHLVNSVSVLTCIWITGALVCWFLRGKKVQFIAEVLTAEILILPIVALFHLLTVVPDSYPDCLVANEIPQGLDYSWVLTRLGNGCGNTMWSADIAHIVIFFKLYDQSIGFGMCAPFKTCCRVLFRVFGLVFASAVVGISIVSQYNYSAGVLSSVFVTTTVCTHQVVPNVAKWCFVRKTAEVSSEDEQMPLNKNRIEI